MLAVVCGRIGTLFMLIFGVAAAAAAKAAIPDIAAGVWPATVVLAVGVCSVAVVAVGVVVTKGERILIRFPATLGVNGLDGFVTLCDGTGF